MKDLRPAVSIILGILIIVGIVGFKGISVNAQEEKVVVSYWHSWGGIDGVETEKLAEEFNRTHPNIKVVVTYTPRRAMLNTSEKLLIAVAAGNAPDLTMLGRPSVSQFAYGKSLLCLDEYAKEDGVTAKDFTPAEWEGACWEGHVYALPFHCGGPVFFWNRDRFQELGLDPNKPPKTIAELEEYADRLTECGPEGGLVRVGFVPWLDQGFLCGWGWIFGGKWYDYGANQVTANHPKNVEALEWIASYAKKYGAHSLDTFTSGIGVEVVHHFYVEKVLMAMLGNWELGEIERYAPDLNYGVGPPPYPPGGEANSAWTSGPHNAIPRGTKHPREAWEFMKFLSGSSDAVLNFLKLTHHLSPNVKLQQNPFFHEGPTGIIAELYFSPQVHNRPCIPEGPLLWQEQNAAMDYARYGEKTPKKALDDVQAKVQKEINKRLHQK